MIVSRTPMRVSFAGGGSDLPSFYKDEPGAVVSTAIDKYIYITVNKKFDRKIRASYSVTEIVDRVDDLRNELIKEALKTVGLDAGVEITSISDVPSEGTGLGSSSTYTVGLLNALYAHLGVHAGCERLAHEACQIEIDRCSKPIGKQDQYIASYGGLQFIQFNPDGTVFVDPIVCARKTKQRIQDCSLLLYTGMTRSADHVLDEQQRNIKSDPATYTSMRALAALAADLRRAICADDAERFGDILHESWMRKREAAGSVTNAVIDGWYERALAAGATGGKILGAGGGGFLLLWAEPGRHHSIIASLPELRPTPWRLEPQGSKIIYVEEGS